MKTITGKRLDKKEKERRILIGVVDLYLKSGKPVGSNTLRKNEFSDISSATIRNYFVKLEQEGYLTQHHSSGGRSPTERAYQVYADTYVDQGVIEEQQEKRLKSLCEDETHEVVGYLQKAIELLSDVTGYAVFLSTPRFDHDFILNMKLISIDSSRCLCILITDFGLIYTEVLYINHPLKAFALKRVEDYICWRLNGGAKPSNLDEKEDQLAQKIYNEIMVRYIVGYTNFSNEDIYTTGLSRLLSCPDLSTPEAFANSLALFENTNNMRVLLRDSCSQKILKYWIGDEIMSYSPQTSSCSVVTIPYYIGGKEVGAVGVLGPMRMPYRSLFGVLRVFSDYVSKTLTRNIMRYKIDFRNPESDVLSIAQAQNLLRDDTKRVLLEDNSQ